VPQLSFRNPDRYSPCIAPTDAAAAELATRYGCHRAVSAAPCDTPWLASSASLSVAGCLYAEAPSRRCQTLRIVASNAKSLVRSVQTLLDRTIRHAVGQRQNQTRSKGIPRRQAARLRPTLQFFTLLCGERKQLSISCHIAKTFQLIRT